MSDTEWRTAKLEELCDVNPPKPPLKTVDDETAALFVPMAAVDDVSGSVTRPEYSTIGKVGRRSYRSFTSGDVLFAKITPCMENGKSAIVPAIPSGYGFGSTEFHVLRARPGTDARLIWHLVRQRSFREKATDHFTGSVGQLRVPPDFLKHFEVHVPAGRADQARLADLLDRAVANASSAAVHLTSARRAIERFRKAVLAAACSGRLTAEWRTAHDAGPVGPDLARHSFENQNTPINKRRLKPALGLRLIGTEFEFPEVWAVKPVRELVSDRAILDVQDGNHGELYPRKSDFSDDRVTGVPFISAESISDRVMIDSSPRLKADVAARLRIGFAKANDVILTHNATVGRVAVVPPDSPDLVLSTSTTYYRVDERVLLPGYLALFLRSHFFQQQLAAVMEQTTRNQVPVTKQVELTIAVPSRDEQLEIVRRADQLIALAERVRKRIDKADQAGQRSSQAVLSKAFRGDLILETSDGS